VSQGRQFRFFFQWVFQEVMVERPMSAKADMSRNEWGVKLQKISVKIASR
jgi:hypothetical protein